MSSSQWNEGGVAEVCEHFQMDLSCLVDGELDEAAAARAMMHLESCTECRDFLSETRNCVSAHRDMADPDRLVARLSALTGSDLAEEARGIELVSRLASVLYQLGKAYVLAGTRVDHRTRVFEDAVPVEPTQTTGRGFVDGVLLSGQDRAGGVDWAGARGLLNGQLKRIESPIEKGRKLLTEALEADPSHEEARIYLAFLHGWEGKTLRAAQEYRTVFRTAIDERNRGHAAVQLGRLHAAEGDHRKSLVCFRWVGVSGLSARDDRFFYVDFNLGVQYARLGQRPRSLAAFRKLIDRNPGRVPEIADLFAQSDGLRKMVESDPSFAESLVATCPELFSTNEDGTPPTNASQPGGNPQGKA